MADDLVPAALGPSSPAETGLVAWLHHLTHERRASLRTVESYGANLRAYLAFLGGHLGGAPSLASLGEVSATDLRAYLASRRSGDHPLSPRSLSQSLSSIRSFYRWLDRRQGVQNNAIALVRGPRVKPSMPRPVSIDSAFDLIGEAGDDPDREGWESARDAAVLTLLYGCGLRISEGLSLKRGDAPLGASLRILGKGRKVRIAPVLPAVQQAVEAYVALTPFAPRPGPDAEATRAAGPARQRHTPRTAPRLRHPSAGRGRGPQNHPGATRPRLAFDHPEIYGGRCGGVDG
jgi:integrase/recombinase XerC